MTRFFVICQGGFGVIERIREEIDFGKKITFTVNHCNHVILTRIGFQTDFEGMARKNLYLLEFADRAYAFDFEIAPLKMT